ncbi:MAG: recombinase family protein [Oscillospiraceae bacterium]
MGIHMGYKAGKVPFRGHLLGFRKGIDGKPEIIPEQAEIVKIIFKNYLKGDSLKNISNYLEQQEIMSPKGNKKWSTSTIISMLMNEKYVGDAILQKTFIQDCLTKKVVKNDGILPMYLIQNHHEAIIDRTTFNRVQQEIARRKGKRKVSGTTTTEQGKYSSKYALTELLICGNCNTPYRRITWARNGKKKVVWRCINRLDYGTKYCKNSPSIEESLLQQAIVRAINENIMSVNEMVTLATKHLSSALQDDDILNKITLQKRIKELKELRSKFICESTQSNISRENFDERFKEIADEMKSITEILKAEEKRQVASESFNAQMKEILQLTKDGEFHMSEYSDKYVRLMIECIKVNSEEEVTVIFKGGTTVEVPLN